MEKGLNLKMEKQKGEEPKPKPKRKETPPPATAATISPMEPLTHEAYGGGMYGHDDDDDGQPRQPAAKPRASESQSADGADESTEVRPNHATPPPSTGDRDLDITGQSYIQ
ncbi:uncharacterized protein LOC133804565 [Humulus lupulus]|uniref:uncharacterized protein LOC133804562 n=1 Tax=Humulus lupulus TaxID=3486 RepID=UPI002B40967B|nr:uncharacterized protein LOC133804562 [Humulus lupulus]XP_062098700.1 uncharacterized protein LOC133804565 [Humulus lupulus]